MVRPMEKCLDCADTKGEVFTPEQFSYVGKKRGGGGGGNPSNKGGKQ